LRSASRADKPNNRGFACCRLSKGLCLTKKVSSLPALLQVKRFTSREGESAHAALAVARCRDYQWAEERQPIAEINRRMDNLDLRQARLLRKRFASAGFVRLDAEPGSTPRRCSSASSHRTANRVLPSWKARNIHQNIGFRYCSSLAHIGIIFGSISGGLCVE
jgi:hypothetical protein